eukprot:1142487-Pelagomonas_calceolata.AAC.2
MGLPHQRVRGKLVWVRRVSGSMRPQGTRIMLGVFDLDGTSTYCAQLPRGATKLMRTRRVVSPPSGLRLALL